MMLLCSVNLTRTMAAIAPRNRAPSTVDGNNTQEELVAKTEKIDALIATVRELNHQVRPLLSGAVGGGSGNLAEVHSIISEMRDRELLLSHSVKSMILLAREGVEAHEVQAMLGTESARVTQEEALAIHEDAETLPTNVVMSEFSSAREAILSLIRELPDESWEAKSELTTEDGADSVEAVIDQIIAADKKAMDRISQLIGARA